jgi:hypothetical protein
MYIVLFILANSHRAISNCDVKGVGLERLQGVEACTQLKRLLAIEAGLCHTHLFSELFQS